MIKIKTSGDKDSIKILSWSLIKNNLDNLKNIEVYVRNTEDAKEYFSMIKFKNISELIEKDGDKIIVDAVNNKMDLLISDEEMNKRKLAWVKPAYKAKKGILYKYYKSVSTASEGCVTDEF